MSPVILGLVLAVPLAAVTARRGWGRGFARIGLLKVPEERTIPPVIVRASEIAEDLRGAAPSEAVHRLAHAPALLAAHRAFLPAGGERVAGDHSPERLVAGAKIADAATLESALKSLSPREKAAALGDRAALDALMRLAGARSA